MKRVLVYDPFSGICGDMHIGAMVDLGVPELYLLESLQSLNLSGWSLKFAKEQRKGITGTRAIVELKNQHEDGHHTHGDQNHHHDNNGHRNIGDIARIVNESGLNNSVRDLTMKIFHAVAAAEAKVHDKPIEEVHFHEVGAVDSIVDIVAAALAIDYLKPDRIISTPPELGGGFVKCAHGTLPVPAPATVEILQGIPTKFGAVNKEMTTPTGAAILAAVVDEFVAKPQLKIEKTGYGVGTRDTEIPNLLRVYWGETVEEHKNDSSGNPIIIECNIDDMNPELYEHAIDLLWGIGVKEVFMSSVIMKKNRPGILLSIMATSNLREKVCDILFNETTTGGVREYPVVQTMLERRITPLQTPYGEINIKRFYYKGKQVSRKAEYEDVRRLAIDRNVPMREIYKAIDLI